MSVCARRVAGQGRHKSSVTAVIGEYATAAKAEASFQKSSCGILDIRLKGLCCLTKHINLPVTMHIRPGRSVTQLDGPDHDR
jgi:hypothetical protein